MCAPYSSWYFTQWWFIWKLCSFMWPYLWHSLSYSYCIRHRLLITRQTNRILFYYDYWTHCPKHMYQGNFLVYQLRYTWTESGNECMYHLSNNLIVIFSCSHWLNWYLRKRLVLRVILYLQSLISGVMKYVIKHFNITMFL